MFDDVPKIMLTMNFNYLIELLRILIYFFYRHLTIIYPVGMSKYLPTDNFTDFYRLIINIKTVQKFDFDRRVPSLTDEY